MRAFNFAVEVSFNGELKLTGRQHHHRRVPTLFVGHKIQLLAGFTGVMVALPAGWVSLKIISTS